MTRKLTLLAVAAAALATSACVTVIGADGDDYAWTGSGAQPLDAAREQCRDRAGRGEGTTAFIQCMSEKGWTRTRD